MRQRTVFEIREDLVEHGYKFALDSAMAESLDTQDEVVDEAAKVQGRGFVAVVLLLQHWVQQDQRQVAAGAATSNDRGAGVNWFTDPLLTLTTRFDRFTCRRSAKGRIGKSAPIAW